MKDAVSYFRKAAQCGHTIAQFNLAQILLEDPTTKVEAAHWFGEASKANHAIAAYNLGQMNLICDGIPKNRFFGLHSLGHDI